MRRRKLHRLLHLLVRIPWYLRRVQMMHQKPDFLVQVACISFLLLLFFFFFDALHVLGLLND